MAWERYGDRRYYYRSKRRGTKVHKDYFGAGLGGKIAAGVDELYRAEEKAEADTARRQRKILADAVSVIRRLNEWCDLVAAAALFAAGFHRPRRHSWRVWRRGKRFLERAR